MHLTFADPRVLVLLVGLPVFALLALRLLDTTPGARLALALRISQVALLVLALARPILGTPSHTLSVVYALDRSDSLTDGEKARALVWVNSALAARSGDDRAGVVVFAQDARVVRPLTASSEPLRLAPAGSSASGGATSPGGARSPGAGGNQGGSVIGGSVLDGSVTDVAAGLRLAASLFLPTGGRRIVLLSDGQENSGSALTEARQLATQGIQVDFVPIGQTPDPEVFVEGVDVASYAREGEPLDIAVAVQSSRDQGASLRLWTDGELTLNQQVQLKTGPNRFTTTLTALTKGFHAFRARIDAAGDTFGQNNEAYAFSVIKNAARVALVTDSPEAAAPLRSLLAQGGVVVDVLAPKAIPSSFGPLKGYDGIVLVDVSAKSLSLDQMKTLEGFVETLGKGLFVVGGPDSYGVGGYDGTVLADLLPVKVRAPSRVDVGSVAMLLVVDRSGSMDDKTDDGATKIGAVRQAAVQAASALKPTDYIGVLAFDTERDWVVPIRPVGDASSQADLAKAVGSLEASGGTEIFPALEDAYKAIRQVQARYKYVILLSDGVSFSSGDWDGLAASMAGDGIVLSTIAVGADADQDLLKRLADHGGGRFYYTNRASDIPMLAVRETQLAAGAPTVEGEIEPRVKSPSPILRSLPTDLPIISGQASATARDGATVALASQRDDPLLAHWQRGLGRVAAWLSDGGGQWAASWTSRADLAGFWPQAVRWTLPTPLDSGLYISTERSPSEVRLRVEAVDDAGALQNLLDLRARVGSSGGEVTLGQVSPGRYEATFAVPSAGAYPVEVVEYRGGQATDHREIGGLVVGYPTEYGRFGPDVEALSALGGPSVGESLGDPAGAYRQSGLRFSGEDREPLWPWLAAVALLLFPFDVGIRRLRLDHKLVRRWIGLFRRQTPTTRNT